MHLLQGGLLYYSFREDFKKQCCNFWTRHNKIDIQNQQKTLSSAKRAKYNKAGWYLVIKFFSRTEYNHATLTVQKLKTSIKGYFSYWKHIHRKLRIYLHLLKKLNLESFIFLCKDFLIHFTFKIMLIRYNLFLIYFALSCVYRIN